MKLPIEIVAGGCGGECVQCKCEGEVPPIMGDGIILPSAAFAAGSAALNRAKSEFEAGKLAAGLDSLQEGAAILASISGGKQGPSLFQKEYNSAGKLDGVDPTVAAVIVESGLEDGDSSDDKISVGKGTWPASKLKPSQTSMVLPKAIGMALGMLASGKVGGDLGALISSDGHILDGHHRWAATILASGSKGSVSGYGAKLPGNQLLRVLNILTKGLFKVRNGKAGKGSLAGFKPGNVRDLLEEYTLKGIPGDYPIPAAKVQSILKDAFGSVEAGIETMAANTKLISKSVPSWAPDRKQMPVIDPGNVPKAVGYMNKGEVDWAPPYKEAADTVEGWLKFNG